MDYKIVWTERAVTDLEVIVAYIAKDNPSAARGIGDDIIAHVELLATFPHIGPHYPRGAKSDDREVLCRKLSHFLPRFRSASNRGNSDHLTW